MIRTVTAFLLIVLASGCSASKYGSADTTFVKSGFDTTVFENGLAILPVVAGQGVEGFRRPFGESINSAVTAQISADAQTWNVTMDRINEAGLVQEYNDAIAAYRETSILDRALLKRVGETMKSRYLLYLQLDPPTASTVSSRSVWGSGTATTENLQVSCLAQIWDTIDGDVVWEGSGEAGVKASSDAFQVMKDSDRDLKIHTDRLADEIVTALSGF